MTTLFLDSSDKLFLGLLNSENDWIGYNQTELKKGASNIHKLLNDLLSEHQIVLKDVKKLVHISGPGSYTGVRITEGLCQIFDWNDFEVFSFYHFDIPQILGIEQGYWVSHAFKGEFYYMHWNGKEEQKSGLLKLSEYPKLTELGVPIFTHCRGEPFLTAEQTSDLMLKNPQKLFNRIISEKWRKPPFYYRKLEDEFKVTEK
ncbi:MAG: hypothetical protein HOM21_06190 [Halobacteriovoraceae bacterium]|nr:hypothetical protein [Halobacteriovoraceae bacterium]